MDWCSNYGKLVKVVALPSKCRPINNRRQPRQFENAKWDDPVRVRNWTRYRIGWVRRAVDFEWPSSFPGRRYPNSVRNRKGRYPTTATRRSILPKRSIKMLHPSVREIVAAGTLRVNSTKKNNEKRKIEKFIFRSTNVTIKYLSQSEPWKKI